MNYLLSETTNTFRSSVRSLASSLVNHPLGLSRYVLGSTSWLSCTSAPRCLRQYALGNIFVDPSDLFVVLFYSLFSFSVCFSSLMYRHRPQQSGPRQPASCEFSGRNDHCTCSFSDNARCVWQTHCQAGCCLLWPCSAASGYRGQKSRTLCGNCRSSNCLERWLLFFQCDIFAQQVGVKVSF